MDQERNQEQPSGKSEMASKDLSNSGENTSQDRLKTVLNHIEVDRPVVDFGGTLVTGISASTLSNIKKALFGDSALPVKVNEPYQMLGMIDEQLQEYLNIDVCGVIPKTTFFGFENKDWKPFTLTDGNEVLVPGDFQVTPTPDGGWFIYPEGDTSVPPSGHMPKDGFYFDSINRQEPIVEDQLDPADNLEEFSLLTDEDISYYANEAERLSLSGKGAVLSTPGTGFGDIALVPAPWMKKVKGIRDVEEWYVSTAMRFDYVYEVFDRQCEIALKNLEKLIPAVGDNVQAAFTTGTDFGTQNGLFISPQAYRNLYMPFHKRINDYIHRHSDWKVFMHSCGSIIELIPDFIEAGFDIINPVQCSAAGMDPKTLKKEFGKDITFWGGGVDTQKTLPFGTPDEVYREVRERIDIFSQGGGFVFTSIHNIQTGTPVDNVIALFKAVKDSAK